MLRRLLASFRRVPGVVGTIVVDDQWTVTATALEMEQDEMLTTWSDVLRESERLVGEVEMGDIEQLWLECELGHIVLAPLVGGHSMLVLSDSVANIGRLRHEVRARTPVIDDMLR